jgi:prepilin-type N-terminal cleavage/methylation domain-containing protein
MKKNRVNKMKKSKMDKHPLKGQPLRNSDDAERAATGSPKGFSMIEVLVGITLIAIAMLGLAQLFAYSIMVNENSNELTNATFLAQQQVDILRNLTQEELNTLSGLNSPEPINPNNDGIIDFTRVFQLQTVDNAWRIRVWVFPGDMTALDASTLIADPMKYKIKAEVSTLISR